jgi:2-dehydropantoate 2-reductase
VAVAETPSSLLLYQLEKLALNAIINPLTALMDCENGEILYNYSFTRVMRMLLIEISSVICALPELQGIPGIENRFAPERLRSMVTKLANQTAKNTSSMLADVRSGKTTEIEYINGYIVRRGEELGIKCAVNYMIKHLVLAKQQMVKQRVSGAIPIDVLDGSKL